MSDDQLGETVTMVAGPFKFGNRAGEDLGWHGGQP